MNNIFTSFHPSSSPVAFKLDEFHSTIRQIYDFIDSINQKFQHRHQFELFENFGRDLLWIDKPLFDEDTIRLKIIWLARLFTERINRQDLLNTLLAANHPRPNKIRKSKSRFLLKEYIIYILSQPLGNIYNNIHKLCLLRNGLDAHQDGTRSRLYAQRMAESILAEWINNGNRILITQITNYPELWHVCLDKTHEALNELDNIL